MSIIFGLTGSLSTGKTLVASYFRKCGAAIIDSDDIVHELFKKDKACFGDVVKEFGKDIVVDGEISRKGLAAIVFKDVVKLQKLEKIIHPRVKKEILKRIGVYKRSKEKKIIVIEVPLLFESGLDKNVDYAIVVKAKLQQQIDRAVKKLKITKAEAKRRIKAQMPLREKVSLADIIIDNSKNKLIVKKEVKIICQRMLKRIKS